VLLAPLIETTATTMTLGNSPYRDSVLIPRFAGCVPFISFVTAAELRFGAHHAGWGPARLQKLEAHLATAEIVWPGPVLVKSYVKLRHDCAAIGHGLGHKNHEADRWIATTALRLRVPLVAHDTIFKNVPGLNLITTLA
jgi:tRNA(fMet)-specific endonuclease VapC